MYNDGNAAVPAVAPPGGRRWRSARPSGYAGAIALPDGERTGSRRRLRDLVLGGSLDVAAAEPAGPAAEIVAAPRIVDRPPREILISYEDEEPKVAIFEGGALVEVDFDRPQGRRIVGNVYKGRVQNVLPGMQAAFVDIGLERNAFLFVDDAHPGAAAAAGEDLPDDAPQRGASGISDLVHVGQEILVQIAKEPVGQKGARVTRAVSLPGRYLVLMPGVDYVGVSRRIVESEERDRLRALAQRLRQPGVGLIVRTAAEGVNEAELEADWRLLSSSWGEIGERARRGKAPVLAYRDLDVVQRTIRDQLNGDITAIVVDRGEELQRLRSLLSAVAPLYADRLAPARPQDLRQGLFAARGVDDEITRALGRRVPLPSGGYLVVDQTEALTAIDVNTGRYVGDAGRGDLADTFLTTNLEAAAEIARQIRLRDTGGIIIVDFIDMDVAEHRRRVLAALEAACAPDHSRPQILGITQLGLVEMTRKKARQSLRDLLTKPCPQCEGRGRVFSEETVSRRIRRQIRTSLRTHPAEAVLVEVHPSIAAMLIGQGGQDLKSLEQQTARTIFIRGATDCGPEQMRVRAAGTRQEVEALARPVRQGQILDLRVDEAHVTSVKDGIARVEGYVVDIEGGAARVGQTVRVEITKAFRTYAKARIV